MLRKKYNPEAFSKKLKTFALKTLLKTKYFFKYGTFDFFNYINIELNTSCNRRCYYCPNSIYDRGLIKNQKLMPEELFKKIINELAKINYTGKILPQNFGEPLLDKRLSYFIKYAKEKLPKAKIYVITNGDYLTKEKYREIKQAGADKIIVSPHDDVEYQEHGMNNRGGLVETKNTCYNPRCLLPDNPVVIDYDGNIVLCCNDYLGVVKFGNVKRQRLIDIWNSQEYKKVRKDLKNRKFRFKICRKCVGYE